ncbi:hypothetical protein CBL_00200 [Carabus blaptoides fortunei]
MPQVTKKLLHCGTTVHLATLSFHSVVSAVVDVAGLMPNNHHYERDRAIAKEKSRCGGRKRSLVMGDDGRFVCDNCAAGRRTNGTYETENCQSNCFLEILGYQDRGGDYERTQQYPCDLGKCSN